MRKNNCFSWLLIFVFIFTMVLYNTPPGYAGTLLSDISGHWAQSKIENMVGQGILSGYPDNTFKPDNKVTRAEFITMVNRAFNFTARATTNHSDIKPGDWYVEEIARAKAAGYISGYEDGTMRPNNPISRQEVAVITSKILKLDGSTSLEQVNRFSDSNEIAAWSRNAVAAMVKAGCMSGYPDGTFKAIYPMTRAEACVILYNAAQFSPGKDDTDKSTPDDSVTYSEAGVYGPETDSQTIKGDVTITVPGVTLQNMVIEGKLILTEKIAEGDVTLKKVTVKGTTDIRGGGENSIIIIDSLLGKVIVAKKNGRIRLTASGSTTIGLVMANSGARFEEKNLSSKGQGFKEIIFEYTQKNDKIYLIGSFDRVEVKSADVIINVATDTRVKILVLQAKAKIEGQGIIEKAEINANGVVFDNPPNQMQVAPGISKPDILAAITGAGGGGGGGGNDSPPTTVSVTNVSAASRPANVNWYRFTVVGNYSKIQIKTTDGTALGPVTSKADFEANGYYEGMASPDNNIVIYVDDVERWRGTPDVKRDIKTITYAESAFMGYVFEVTFVQGFVIENATIRYTKNADPTKKEFFVTTDKGNNVYRFVADDIVKGDTFGFYVNGVLEQTINISNT